ncbi:MAG: hypothetical protein A2W31_05100 [Planctomycetes bacterium RBG_16_64_10]|nr:MAG: hypothetical protein A2W31_05100 [Planctomycetes bacterium RBG_16_64_10]
MAVVLLMVFAVGCNKVSKEEVIMFEAAASAAKERATVFSLAKDQIAPLETGYAKPLAAVIADHSAGLNLQAKAFHDIVTAVSARRVINDVTALAIIDSAKTADARAKAFAIWSKRVVSKDPALAEEFKAFIEGHQRGLTTQADILGTIRAKLEKECAKAIARAAETPE